MLIVASHYVFIKDEFIVDGGNREECEILKLNTPLKDSLSITYKKNTLRLKTIYSIDARHFFITIQIGKDKFNDFIPVASYINEKKLMNEQVLIQRIDDVLHRSISDHTKQITGRQGAAQDDKRH
ncbi:unnamed protein product [Adineta steineri]|uniref:Uncharacterized protein n=1 Tax=Adineta steineri TaxID=433720 RepID=A0A815WT02_9BILA|nr:unnamed protein product [Adineta steineri]CAF1548184.1 unnamed protein product [Adineta steineri]